MIDERCLPLTHVAPDDNISVGLEWSSLTALLLARGDVANQLSASYQRCFSDARTRTCELVLLTGPAGVGKTTVAFSLQKKAIDDNGFMVWGKFEQLENNLQAATTKVYSAFAEAFTHFIEQVMDTGEEVIQSVKERLESNLDFTELQVLQEIIPNLNMIVKKQKSQDRSEESSSILKGADADDRLIEILCRFVGTICSIGKPVVLLLDDLHWANKSSLNLLTHLIVGCEESCAPPSLLLVCTCRKDELRDDHPVVSMWRDLKGKLTAMTELQVSNLTEAQTVQVVSGVLQVPAGVSRPLSEFLFRQTEGNPLFLVELIKSLREDKVLLEAAGQWTWDMENVLALGKIGSVNRLFENKVQRLDAREQELLRIASCLGSSFSIAALSNAGVFAKEDINLVIEKLERKGLISCDNRSGICRFIHDKVQQTVYQLTPECVVEQLHLNIGRQLKRSMQAPLLAENIILVSHQIGLGVHLIDDPIEKEDIAELFCKAGQQAALSSCFLTAAAFLNLAIGLLSRRHWKDQYKLSLRLYNFAAELEYYNGNFQRFDELVDAVLLHARCFDDTLVTRFTRIYSLGSRGSMKEALDQSLAVLKSMGETFPLKPTMMHVVFGLIRSWSTLRGKTDEDILGLPPMQDKQKQAAMRLMIFAKLFAFYSSGKHVPLIAFRLTENTLRYGISEMACVGFGCLGMVNAYQGNIDIAYRYSRLSLRLFEQFGAKEWQARVCVVVHGMVTPLKHSIRETLEPLCAAHRSSLVLGDVHFSMLCNTIYASRCYFAGYPLWRVLKETRRCRALCIKFGQFSTQSWVDLYLQQVLNLMGQSSDPLVLTGEVTNEEEAMRISQAKNPLDYLFLHFSKLQLAVYMNDVSAAKQVLGPLKAMDRKKFLPNMMALLHFYEGFAYAMSVAPGDRKQARKCLAKLKLFAKHSPSNYQNKVYLIEAELASHVGEIDVALATFTHAIEMARCEGFIQDQALASERAAYALASAQRKEEADQYLVTSRTLYAEWGAKAKVDRLTAIP